MSWYDFQDFLELLSALGPLGGIILAIIGLIFDSSLMLWGGIIWFIIGIVFWGNVNTRAKEHEEEQRKRKAEEAVKEKEALFTAWNIPQCKIDAPKGDPEAQYLLGRAYLEGIGVSVDEAEGFYWLEQAAGHGHREAYKYLYNRQRAIKAYEREAQSVRNFHEDYMATERNKHLADISRKMGKGH